MTSNSTNDKADRIAGGTGAGAGGGENEDIMPGEIGGGQTYLPSDGRGEAEGTPAASAPGTVGAVGEMDFMGAPAGTSGAGDAGAGSSAGAPVGGASGGGGSMSGSGDTGVEKE